MITRRAVLGGYEDWGNIEDFGYANEAWLRRFLELPNGIPQFGEDGHRARKDHSAASLGLIRRTALNLLQQIFAPGGMLLCCNPTPWPGSSVGRAED